MSKKHHHHLIALCDKAIRQLNAMGKPQETAGLIQSELDDIDRLIAEYQRLKANLLLKAENTAALAQKEARPMADRLLFPKDVAAVLGCTIETARDLMRGMRCINTSRNPDGPRPRWAVTRTELERWQRTGTEVPASRIRKRQPAKDPTPAPKLPKGYDAALWEIDKNGNRRIAYRHSNRTA